MKNILLILFLLSGTILRAQSFEGIMTWKISADIDPATKAKMDAAQQKMNDPEAQAQMKQMKEKMNDPEFKKMMEANPQLKTQMERLFRTQPSLSPEMLLAAPLLLMKMVFSAFNKCRRAVIQLLFRPVILTRSLKIMSMSL